MKILLLLTAILAQQDNGRISYMCNQCDLYDMDTKTIFDYLDVPGLNLTYYNQEMLQLYENQQLVNVKLTMSTLINVCIAIINLIATITVLVTERKISISAQKTYQQMQIIDQ